MYSLARLKQTTLLLGDVLTLYLSLGVTLVIRYGYQSPEYLSLLSEHLATFSALFALWLIIFYISGLYDLGALKNNASFYKKFWGALAVSAILSIIYFYFLSTDITPKTINHKIYLVLVCLSRN